MKQIILRHFIYGYMASDIFMVKYHSDRERERERESETGGGGGGKEKTCCRLMGYSFRLTARVIIYAPPSSKGSFIWITTQTG